MPDNDRGRRASFDLADLEIEAGNDDRGHELLYDAMLKHPNDGLARRALERYLVWFEQNGGEVVGWLRTLAPRLASTELDETARYLLATRIEAASDWQQARDAYLACAERHPYPEGALFDDALWRASLLDERLGRAQDAILDLRRMLAVREESTFAGSYERPRFSPAQFRIAVLYRDLLADHPSARREFHRLYAAHKSSILRDDALWEEAKLARDDGDSDAACALAAKLAAEFRDSRYAPCAGALCPSLAPASMRCHPYILRP
jgi:hypothetical protein